MHYYDYYDYYDYYYYYYYYYYYCDSHSILHVYVPVYFDSYPHP